MHGVCNRWCFFSVVCIKNANNYQQWHTKLVCHRAINTKFRISSELCSALSQTLLCFISNSTFLNVHSSDIQPQELNTAPDLIQLSKIFEPDFGPHISNICDSLDWCNWCFFTVTLFCQGYLKKPWNPENPENSLFSEENPENPEENPENILVLEV